MFFEYTHKNILLYKNSQERSIANQPTQGRGCNCGCRLHPHWCPYTLLIFMLLLFMLFFIPILMLILAPQWWCVT